MPVLRKNGTGKNGAWPDLKKRTAFFSQYTVYWAVPYAAFFIHRFRIFIHHANCFFHHCSQGIDILIFGADARRYYSFFYRWFAN